MQPDAEAMAASVVLAFETAIKPVLARVTALSEQVMGLEARWADLNALRERVTVIETKEIPVVTPEKGDTGERGEGGPSGPPGERGEKGDPGERGESGPMGASGENGVDGLIGPEGPAGRDGRDGLPGVAGQTGAKGADGVNGIDGLHGKDGLGFDDLESVYDEYGRLSLKFARGEQVKQFRVPCIVDRGVYQFGGVYLKGDAVTFGGAFWIAQQDTHSKPGLDPDAWRLSVKAGRDGRDARTPTPSNSLPVVRTK